MIECRTLGPVEVTLDGGPPPAELLWRKNLALLVYLARSPKRARTRDHLTWLLWGDKPDAQARHSLREAIRVLRRALGERGLVTDHDQIRLAADAVGLDTDRFEAAERAGDWAAAAQLAAGDFLEGFGVPDATGFEDWVAAERSHWRSRGSAALVSHARGLLARGRLREAGDTAARALGLEPMSDAAVRLAMTALALAGDRNGALAHYERLHAALAEAGGEPDRETRALAEQVRRERTWRLAEAVAATSERGAESRRAPLVGREAQLERLVDAWRTSVREGTATAVVVEADAGMGKTRLLEEVVARARLEGAAVSAVRAVESDREAPWSGVLGIVRGGLLDAPGLAGAPAAALAAFASQIPEWADRFPCSGPPSAPDVAGRALTDVLRAVTAEQPTCVAADDAHWLDRDSLLALAAALRDLADAPLFLVLAAAPQPGRPELDELRARLGRDVPGVGMRLQPLGQEALRQLAAWAVPALGHTDLDRLARRLAVDTAGLPLLAVEILHAVALGMDLGAIAGAWPEPLRTLEQTLPGDLPDAVVAAIRVGFRKLSAEAQQVLTAAAVLGERVPAAQLGRGARMSGEAVTAALDELEWQRWLTAEPRGYAFVARIVRDVVAQDMLTEGQRRRILEAAGT